MLEEFKNDISLFVETALIAIKQGDEQSAKQILKALALLNPKDQTGNICYGLIHLNKLELNKAMQCFAKVLKLEPQNYRAMGFLAFAKVATILDEKYPKNEKIQNMSEGMEIAKKVLKESDESSTKQLAQSVVDWMEEIKQKTSGPL